MNARSNDRLFRNWQLKHDVGLGESIVNIIKHIKIFENNTMVQTISSFPSRQKKIGGIRGITK
jgi:hypothetical protein